MNHAQDASMQKTHPATREILPDDPMEMQGFEVPGDTELMLRLLVEEYARMGCGVQMLMQLARDPNYRAFYGLRELFGEDELRRRISEILARCGVMHVSTKETQWVVGQLVQLDSSRG